MRGTRTGAFPTAGGPVETRTLHGGRPEVVVWEADGVLPDGRGYGAAIADRLAASGIAARVVPLARRSPTPDELAAPAHVLSGGVTPATTPRGWVRRARLALAPVLERALAGEATVTGICFGSQLIAATMAGPRAVGPNPRGMEAGLTVVRPPVRTGRDPGADVVVAQFHYHHIEPAAIVASGGEIVLTNDHTTVQAFAVGPTILGVQFHPVLDPATTRSVVHAHRQLIRTHGLAPAAALSSIDHLAGRWQAASFDHLVTARVCLATARGPAAAPEHRRTRAAPGPLDPVGA